MVANTRERPDGLWRQLVEQGGRVADLLGERAAGREVKVANRFVRHVAVHVRDVPIELLGIDALIGGLDWVCGVCLHAGSVAGTPSRNLPGHGSKLSGSQSHCLASSVVAVWAETFLRRRARDIGAITQIGAGVWRRARTWSRATY